MGPFDGIVESSSLIGFESACWIPAVYSPFCCNASYLARVFCLPHQNPAPSIAIARTPNGTPTPTPIAIFSDDFVSLFFKDNVAVTVAVTVAFESKLMSVGLRVNSFSSVQHSFVLPQQNDPSLHMVTSVEWFEDPPALIFIRVSVILRIS